MNEADALEIIQRAIMTVLVISGPIVSAAMIVGVVIALLQALTQVQEMTLTFVPKIIAIFATLSFAASFIGAQIYAFSQAVYSRIATGF
jgi:flagellar biosynthetic protein FliQ